MTQGARLAVRCQISGYGMLLGLTGEAKGCSEEEIDALAQKYAAQLGTTFTPPRAAEQIEREAWQRTYRANRCFPYSIKAWETNPASRRRYGGETWSLDYLRRYAEQSIAGIETPPEQGKGRSDALTRYMEVRLIMTDNAAYFLGTNAWPSVVALFVTPRHQRAIAVFRDALTRPAFAAHFERSAEHQESVKLLAEMPDAVPCDLRIAEGNYRRDPKVTR